MNSETHRVTGLILAAGGSTRMGRPKALLKQAGQPLIVDHIQALEKRCAEVVVVLGAHASDIASVLPRTTRIVLNPKWETTELRDSLRMGLANLNGSVLITPVDVPPAPEHVLDALIKTGAPSVPVYANQTGHPVFVDAVQTEQQLHSFRLDHIIASATKTEVDWPHTVLNINTPEQWKSYLSD